MAINNSSANALILSDNITVSGFTTAISVSELSSVLKFIGNTKGEFKGNNSTGFSLQRSNVSNNNTIFTIINTKYSHRNEMLKLQIRSRLCCCSQPWRRILICKLP